MHNTGAGHGAGRRGAPGPVPELEPGHPEPGTGARGTVGRALPLGRAGGPTIRLLARECSRGADGLTCLLLLPTADLLPAPEAVSAGAVRVPIHADRPQLGQLPL